MARKNNVLAIMSPKGGVGKTVTAVNLGAALSEYKNKKILLIDTNVSTASLGMHLNLVYPKVTINEISGKNLPKEKIVHHYTENLDVIPASIQFKKKSSKPEQVIKEMYKIIEGYDSLLDRFYKDYDMIILDCAPGLDIESLATMQVAGGLMVVTNPEYPSIVSAAKCIEYAKNSKMPVGGIVLTKVRGKRHEPTKDEIEKALKVKVIQEIPFDKRISESINKKIPIVLLNPYSKSSRAYKRLANSMFLDEDVSLWDKIKRTLNIRSI